MRPQICVAQAVPPFERKPHATPPHPQTTLAVIPHPQSPAQSHRKPQPLSLRPNRRRPRRFPRHPAHRRPAQPRSARQAHPIKRLPLSHNILHQGTIRNADFSGSLWHDVELSHHNYDPMLFENCRFNGSTFKGAYWMSFGSRPTVTSYSFDGCVFKNLTFSSATFKNCTFNELKKKPAASNSMPARCWKTATSPAKSAKPKSTRKP